MSQAPERLLNTLRYRAATSKNDEARPLWAQAVKIVERVIATGTWLESDSSAMDALPGILPLLDRLQALGEDVYIHHNHN